MRYAIAVLGALGLALMVAGLPVFRVVRLADRVTPYVRGTLGAVGGYSGRPAAVWRVRHRIGKWVPAPNAALKERLLAAGEGTDAEAFRVDQAMWAMVAALGAGMAAVAVGGSGLTAAVNAAVALPIGVVARDLLLTARTTRRRERVVQELPVAVDLLTLSVMAGEAVPAALDRVGRLLPGDVGGEFRSAFGSMRTGSSLDDALAALSARLPHPGVTRLADALCTAVEHGSPVADALRAQADDLREVRRRHLMEVGGRREVAMLIPVVFLILPTLIAFALFPGLVALDLLVP